MVDPNRKINRLTVEDIKFLDECEELFGSRFSESDEEFISHCERCNAEPGIVMNFSGAERSSSGNMHGHKNTYRGRYNDNGSNHRGGYRGLNRREPYHKREGGSGNEGRYRHHHRRYKNNEHNDEYARNVRREYGKFVSASNNQNSPPEKIAEGGND